VGDHVTSVNIKALSCVRRYKRCRCIRTSFILLRLYTKSKLMFIRNLRDYHCSDYGL